MEEAFNASIKRSPLQSNSRKPLCDGCANCGVIILRIACPESKEAAAEKDARLVCGPKMSEPACVPQVAAASVDNRARKRADAAEAIRQRLERTLENCAGFIADKKAAAEKDARLVREPHMSEPFSAFAAAESKKAAAELDASLGCIPKLSEPACVPPEADAILVCRPKMSEPACVPPEAAASVDNLVAVMHALSRALDALALFYQRTKEPMHAAFDSNMAPMPDERADAHLAPQGHACHVGVPPEAAASDDNLLAMRHALSRVKNDLLLLAQMTEEPMRAAFKSNEAPMPGTTCTAGSRLARWCASRGCSQR
jgi:hypothetical protein